MRSGRREGNKDDDPEEQRAWVEQGILPFRPVPSAANPPGRRSGRALVLLLVLAAAIGYALALWIGRS